MGKVINTAVHKHMKEYEMGMAERGLPLRVVKCNQCNKSAYQSSVTIRCFYCGYKAYK